MRCCLSHSPLDVNLSRAKRLTASTACELMSKESERARERCYTHTQTKQTQIENNKHTITHTHAHRMRRPAKCVTQACAFKILQALITFWWRCKR